MAAAVAVGLVHREEQRALVAGGVEAAEDLLGRGLAPVGVVLADVGVGVEPVGLAQRLAPVEEDGQQARDRTGFR